MSELSEIEVSLEIDAEDQERAEKVCDDAKAMCKRINESLESDDA